MKTKIALLSMLFCMALTSVSWADAKSATIRVSCTVKPMIEMSAPSFRNVEAKSNLEKKFQMTEDLRQTSAGLTRFYSLTAL